MTPRSTRSAFMAYVAGLLADFDRYLAAGTPDLGHYPAGDTVAFLHLSDAELTGFLRDFAAIVQPRLPRTRQRTPTPARSTPSSCPSQTAEVRP